MGSAITEVRRSPEERNALVLQYQGLVRWVWKRYKRQPLLHRLGREDAIAAGQLGLIRAGDLFDESLGVTFMHYAIRWIYQAMQRAAADILTIRIPADVAVGCGSEERQADARKAMQTTSLEGKGVEGGRPWEPLTLTDPPMPWDLEGWEELQEALRHIHRHYRDPFLWFYRDECTYSEIGRRLGVSSQAVQHRVIYACERLAELLGVRSIQTPAEAKRCRA